MHKPDNSIYQAIAESTQDIIFVLDHQGYVRYVNRYAAEFFGSSAENITGKNLRELFRPEACEFQMQAVGTVLETGRVFRTEENRSFTDKQLWLETRLIPVKDSKGKVELVLGVSRDITERKLAEEALKKHQDHLEELVARRTKELSTLNEQLRHAQKMEELGILAGGVAHEFSNILTTIKGSLYLVQKGLETDSRFFKYIEQINSSINKATTLINGLLTFSRKQVVSLQPFDLNEIVISLKSFLSQLISENIELTLSLTEAGPVILGDRNQVEQVLINLINNAVDAMPGGGKLDINTTLVRTGEDFREKHGYGSPGEYAVLSVSDTGTGISDEATANIFEPFFTTKEAGKGTGLGLAITYAIVKQHGGYINVVSEPGKGTAFHLYFPRNSQPGKRHEETQTSKSAVNGGTETILIAEDDADTRKILADVLRLSGYTVLEASDGEDALRVFHPNRDRIQLLLLDVRMPGKNGKEVYQEIKRTDQNKKVLLMSGYTADVLDKDDLANHGLHFISKSALPEEILKEIRDMLDS